MDVHYWPIATFPCAAKIGRFRGIADMAALVDGSTLVANDPKRRLPGMDQASGPARG